MSKLIPLADYVVCVADKPETKTASGLYLPENSQEKPRTAEVIAVGKDVKEIKVKDRVIYKSYSTTEVTIDKDSFILVKEEDVLATVSEK